MTDSPAPAKPAIDAEAPAPERRPLALPAPLPVAAIESEVDGPDGWYAPILAEPIPDDDPPDPEGPAESLAVGRPL